MSTSPKRTAKKVRVTAADRRAMREYRTQHEQRAYIRGLLDERRRQAAGLEREAAVWRRMQIVALSSQDIADTLEGVAEATRKGK